MISTVAKTYTPRDGVLGTLSLAGGRTTPSVPPLPNEIISEIFIFSLPRRARSDERSKRCYETISKLASVCHLWRDITLQTPQLWTSVAFNPHRRSEIRSQIDMIQVLLGRSGVAPIDVFLDFQSPFVDEQICQEVADLLIPHFHRLQEVSVAFRDIVDSIARAVFQSLEGLPRLRRVRIILSDVGFLDPLPDVRCGQLPLLALDALSVWNDGNVPISTCFLQRARPDLLLELDIARSDLDERSIYDFLSRCTSLKALKIHLPPDGVFIPAPEDRLRLDSLEFLEIASFGRSTPLMLADAPNVTHLKLNRRWTPVHIWPTMPSLKTITINWLQSLSHMYDMPHTVSDLRIYGGVMQCSNILSCLYWGDHEHPTPPLPALKSLRLRISTYNPCEHESISCFLGALVALRPMLTVHLMAQKHGASKGTQTFWEYCAASHVEFGKRVKWCHRSIVCYEPDYFML